MFNLFRKKSSSGVYREPISIGDFKSVIDSDIGPGLISLGFTAVSPCKWVLNCGTGVRKVVELSPHKGGVYHLLRGLSLDAVPHFNSSFTKLRYHRSDTSAVLDLFALYDDYSRFRFNQFVTAEEHLVRVKEVAPLFLGEMDTFIQQSSHSVDLLEICEKSREVSGEFAEFYTHTQLRLAYAYLLNRSGCRERAVDELSRFISDLEIEEQMGEKLFTVLEIVHE